MRKRSGHNSRGIMLQSNWQYKGGMSVDHSFPKTSADKLSFSFAQEVPTLNNGEQWGSVQIFLDIEESDYPQLTAFQETIGLAAGPETGLREYEHDPTTLDLAIRNNHLPKLRELYIKGEIADETEPKKDKQATVSYAKSSVNLKRAKTEKPALMNEDGTPDWSRVTEDKRAKTQADDLNSVSLPESSDLSYNLKSSDSVESLKRRFMQAERNKNENAAMENVLSPQTMNKDDNETKRPKKHTRIYSDDTELTAFE
jgi:hypothetical protein